MDFRHTDEQQRGRTCCTASWRKRSGREYTREHDENREFPDEVYRKIGRQRLARLLIPEEHGGLAADPVMYAIFCEAIAKFSLDTAACLMTSMFTVNNIVHHGTRSSRPKHLPASSRASAGSRISISEPQAGSDAAGLTTKAVRDGDAWVLNGNKTWCSGAHLPGTVIALLARTGPGQARRASACSWCPTTPRASTSARCTRSSAAASGPPRSS